MGTPFPILTLLCKIGSPPIDPIVVFPTDIDSTVGTEEIQGIGNEGGDGKSVPLFFPGIDQKGGCYCFAGQVAPAECPGPENRTFFYRFWWEPPVRETLIHSGSDG